MPRTKKQIENIREKRKTQILDASLKLFAIHGFDNVTSDDITKEAKCSHGLFYHYFNSKEEILQELIKKTKDEYREQFEDFSNEVEYKNVIDVIDMFTKKLIYLINRSEEDAYRIYMVLTLPLTSINQRKRGFDRDFFNHLRKAFEVGQEAGDLVLGDTKSLVITYYSILVGMCFTKIRLKSNLDKKFDANVIADIFKRKE